MNKSKQLKEQGINKIITDLVHIIDSPDKTDEELIALFCIAEIKKNPIKETLKHVIDQAKSELLEEVRNIIGEDESWFSMTGYTRNDFRRTLKKKLSILEGEK